MTLANTKIKKFVFFVSIFFLILSALIMYILSTSKYGPGVSSDSVHYVTSAQGLLEGRGLTAYSGKPFISWPPLFPVMIAGISAMGIDPYVGVRFLNAIALCLVIVLLLKVLAPFFENRITLFLCLLFILISSPLFRIACYVWSETIFTLFLLATLLSLNKYLKRGLREDLLWVIFLSILCCLQRYVGIVVVFSVAVSILLHSKLPYVKRIFVSVLYSFISLTPLVLWLLRNYQLNATFTGHRAPSPYLLSKNIMYTLDNLSKWFFPFQISYEHRSILFLVLTLLCLFFIVRAISVKGVKQLNILGKINPEYIFTVSYVAFIIIFSTFSAMNKISNRYLSCASVFIIAFMFIGIEKAYFSFKKKFKINYLSVAIASLVIGVWFSFFSAKSILWIQERYAYGAGAFNSDVCRKSSVLRWVRNSEIKGLIYSNFSPDGIYFTTGKVSRWIPARWELLGRAKNQYLDANLDHMLDEMRKNKGSVLVWFDAILQWHLPSSFAIRNKIPLKTVFKSEDGEVMILDEKRIK